MTAIPLPARAPTTFPVAMRAIHWASAGLMLLVLVLAWISPEGETTEGSIVMLHKAFGITLLALTAARLALRNMSRIPPEDTGVPHIEALAARVSLWLLYGILFAMPLSGYLSEAARGRGVDMFGLFTVPALLPASAMLHDAAWTLHSAGQLAVYAVVGLHAAASLYHLVVRRDGVMARMWPGVSRLMPQEAAHPAAE